MDRKKEKNNQYVLFRFYENLAIKYEDISYYLNPIGISRKKKVTSISNPKKSDIFCDLGCGDGNLSKDIVKKAKEVYGVDISRTRVRRAQIRGIKSVCADVCLVPLKSNSFDKVICSEIIEHVINKEKLLEEVHRILKIGGTAVLSVPINQKLEKTLLDVRKEDLDMMDYEKIKKKYQVMDDHLSSFSEDGFIKLLEKMFIIRKIDYTYEYKEKVKMMWIVSFLGRLLIKRSNIIETIYNKIIFSFYKEQKEKKHHIIVQVEKNRLYQNKKVNSS